MRKRTRLKRLWFSNPPSLPLSLSLHARFLHVHGARVFRYRGWILSHLRVDLIYSSRVNVSRQSADYGERYVQGGRGDLAWLARRDRVVAVYAGYRWKNSIHEFVDRSRPRCIRVFVASAPHCARINYVDDNEPSRLDPFPPIFFLSFSLSLFFFFFNWTGFISTIYMYIYIYACVYG